MTDSGAACSRWDARGNDSQWAFSFFLRYDTMAFSVIISFNVIKSVTDETPQTAAVALMTRKRVSHHAHAISDSVSRPLFISSSTVSCLQCNGDFVSRRLSAKMQLHFRFSSVWASRYLPAFYLSLCLAVVAAAATAASVVFVILLPSS